MTCHGCTGTCCTGIGSDPCVCVTPAEPAPDHIAWAMRVRADHEATHGEAEQCDAPCIVLGLAEFAGSAVPVDDGTEALIRAVVAYSAATGRLAARDSAEPTYCDQCPHAMHLHEADGSCGGGCH